MKFAFFAFLNLVHGWGFEKYIMSLATEMAKRGHKTSIVTVNQKVDYAVLSLLRLYYRNRFSLRDVVRLSRTEIHRSLKGVCLNETSSFKEMKRHLSAVDVIYSKNEILDLFMLRMLNNDRTLPPVICGVHSPILLPVANSFYSKLHNCLYSSKLYDMLLNSCSAIHVPNSTEAKIISDIFPDIKAKIFYIPHFFEGSPESAINQASTFNILFIGRLTEQKGIDTFLKVVEGLSVRHEFQDMKFTIVGTGDLDMKLKVIEICNKHTNVEYKAYVEEQMMPSLYLSHDICVVPSRWETVSLVCMEAQNYGLPVVASNIPGPRDIVINRETGVLITPEDLGGFTKAILDFYSLKMKSPEDFESMRKMARKSILSRFSKGKIIPMLEKMLINTSKKG